MMFGSNELIYVPGSPLPIMIEEFEEDDEDIDTSVAPSVPPRTKVARTSSMTKPDLLPSYPKPLPRITLTEDSDEEGPNPPEIKPRLKNKLKHYKSEPFAFVDTDPMFPPAASDPIDDIKVPETLPRTRRGQNKNKVVENILEPCVSISPPPRMYATIPRKRKIDPNPVCVS